MPKPDDDSSSRDSGISDAVQSADTEATPGKDSEPGKGDRSSQRKTPIFGLLYGAASFLMIGISVTINPIFCTQVVGWSQERYSQIDGGISAGAGIAGALLGGFLVDRLGVGRLVTLTVLLLVVLLPVILSTFAAGRDAYDGASEQLTEWHEEVFGNETRGS